MGDAFDVLVIGSGPAGVSAAFPLLEAGLRVAMVDGGRVPVQAPPQQDFLSARAQEPDQWQWMLGRDFHAPLAFAFEGFAAANRVAAEDFIAVGSLAAGGLSNAWGCGVARFSDAEGCFPFPASELDASYDTVARRMGISGAGDDDLSAYFGLDPAAEPALPLDGPNALLLRRYAQARGSLHAGGFRLGRSRVAVLAQSRGERQACNLSGNCLFGCYRGAMYSAASPGCPASWWTSSAGTASIGPCRRAAPAASRSPCGRRGWCWPQSPSPPARWPCGPWACASL